MCATKMKFATEVISRLGEPAPSATLFPDFPRFSDAFHPHSTSKLCNEVTSCSQELELKELSSIADCQCGHAHSHPA